MQASSDHRRHHGHGAGIGGRRLLEADGQRPAGSVRLEVSGAFPERFLNLCAHRALCSGTWSGWRPPACASPSPGREVARPGRWGQGAVYRGAGGTVRRALFLGRFRRRYALLVGLALSPTAVCVLSQFVLTIKVEGNEAVSTAGDPHRAAAAGAAAGGIRPGLDEGTISNAGLLGLPELAWMSVNLHGTRAEVLVREAVPAPEVDDEEQVGAALWPGPPAL